MWKCGILSLSAIHITSRRNQTLLEIFVLVHLFTHQVKVPTQSRNTGWIKTQIVAHPVYIPWKLKPSQTKCESNRSWNPPVRYPLKISVFDCERGVQRRLVNSQKYGVDLARFTHAKNACVHASTKVDDDIRWGGGETLDLFSSKLGIRYSRANFQLQVPLPTRQQVPQILQRSHEASHQPGDVSRGRYVHERQRWQHSPALGSPQSNLFWYNARSGK